MPTLKSDLYCAINKIGELVYARYKFIIIIFCIPIVLIGKLSIIPFNYSFSGYVKGEMYSDSRQTFGSLPDEIPFFPKRIVDDPQCHDINARGQTQMDAFETRLRLDIDAIRYKRFSIEGVIETDFEIFFVDVVDLIHMRHAYLKIQTDNATLTFGQTWHPMVFIEPQTVNYNGSSPFDYYARSPQFNFTYRTKQQVDIIFAATMQVDYSSDGAYGLTPRYMQWATLPNFHLQYRWRFKTHVIGAGIDYKRIAPRITSSTGFKIYERLSSVAFLWFLGLKWPVIEIYIKVNGGQNASDYSGMGGYAVQKNSTEPITDQRKYTNLNNIAAWMDLSITKHPVFNPGIFIGVSKNLGASKKIDHDSVGPDGIINRKIFGFANDVDTVFRISPRLSGKINSIVFSGEVEYTRANFGTITNKGTVINTRPAELIRCTFASYYYF